MGGCHDESIGLGAAGLGSLPEGGGRQAIGEMWKTVQGPLRAIVRNKNPRISEEDAEEVVQEAFISFWIHRRSILNPWSYMVSSCIRRSRSKMYDRGKANQLPPEGDIHSKARAPAPHPLLPFEVEDLLEGWLGKLEDLSLRILELKGKGLDAAEIGKELGLCERTIWVHLAALKRWAEEFFLSIMI